MARINIEDSIYQDTRFIQLMLKFKDIDKALGVMVRSWAIAQKWYVRSENRMIPIEDWNKQLLPNELFEVGLAEKDQSGEWVHIAGSDEQFAWLLQRVEAGRKSGMRRGKQDQNPSTDERILRNGARAILNRAVVDGKLDKPKFCADCGATGVVIEGHHSDYNKPLEVDWLCKKCHTETHRNIRMTPDQRPLDSVERPLTGTEPSSLSPSLSLTQERKNIYICDSQKFENSLKFDFNALFEIYPRHQKKTQSLTLMAEKVFDAETYDQLKTSINNYSDYCKTNFVEPQFILTFPGFFREWEDWLNNKNGSSKVQPKTISIAEILAEEERLKNK